MDLTTSVVWVSRKYVFTKILLQKIKFSNGTHGFHFLQVHGTFFLLINVTSDKNSQWGEIAIFVGKHTKPKFLENAQI
jgi:hypothetical protein